MKDYAPPMKHLRRRTIRDTISNLTYNKCNLRTTLVGGGMLIAALSIVPVYDSINLTNLFGTLSPQVREDLSSQQIDILKTRQDEALNSARISISQEKEQPLIVTKKEAKFDPKITQKNISSSLEPILVDSTIHYLQLGVFANKKNADVLYKKFDSKYGFEVIREDKHINGRRLESILVNYYGDEKLKSFIEGKAGINRGVIVKKKGKVKFYSSQLKTSLIEQMCQEEGLDKNYFLSIRQNESASGKDLFGFDFEPRYKKHKKGDQYKNENGDILTAKGGELVRAQNGKAIINGYVHKLNNKGKIHKLTAVGEYHINPLAHNEKVRDLIDYDYNLRKAVSHVKFLHKYYDGDLELMASAYVAGTNGNFNTQEVIRYRDAVVNTFKKLKDNEIKYSLEFAQR